MSDVADPVLITQAEYAVLRKDRGLHGGTRAAVGKAVATGRIPSHGERKLINPVEADLAWARNTRYKSDLDHGPSQRASASMQAAPLPAASAHSGNRVAVPQDQRRPFADHRAVAAELDDAADDGDLMYHRTREMAAKATLLELELAELSKQLVRSDDVRRHTMSAFRFLRDMLQGFGRQVSPKVAHLTDQHEIQAVVDAEMRNVLGTFNRRLLTTLTGGQSVDMDSTATDASHV